MQFYITKHEHWCLTKKASTQKSAKPTTALFLCASWHWPLTVWLQNKWLTFPGLILECSNVKFGDADIVRKNRQKPVKTLTPRRPSAWVIKRIHKSYFVTVLCCDDSFWLFVARFQQGLQKFAFFVCICQINQNNVYVCFTETNRFRQLYVVVIPMSHQRFYRATLSRDKVAARNCACRTLQLCRINQNWPISLFISCLCDKVALRDMHSCVLQLSRAT